VSTYYYLVCDKHHEFCDAASSTGAGSPLGDALLCLPSFVYRHRHAVCQLRVGHESEVIDRRATEGPWGWREWLGTHDSPHVPWGTRWDSLGMPEGGYPAEDADNDAWIDELIQTAPPPDPAARAIPVACPHCKAPGQLVHRQDETHTWKICDHCGKICERKVR
jgi:hypothetical protein